MIVEILFDESDFGPYSLFCWKPLELWNNVGKPGGSSDYLVGLGFKTLESPRHIRTPVT